MKPILFSTPMVQAILAGRKTQTRRVLKPQPVIDAHGMWLWKDCQWMDDGLGFPASGIEDYAPYKPGDILWVRETWALQECEKCRAGMPSLGGECKCDYVYRTNYGKTEDDTFPPSMFRWRPSIHMPREAARLFLRVKDVRVERIHSITVEDAVKEGVYTDTPGYWDNGWSPTFNDPDSGGEPNYINGFKMEWDARNAKRGFGWEENPWVWVIEFERIEAADANK